MALKTVFSFGTQPFDPTNRFATSWLLPPWMLLACRALIVRSSPPRPLAQD